LVPSQVSPSYRWRLLLTLTAIFASSYVGWHYFVTINAADAAVDPRTRGPGAASAAIPVTIARAASTDFPVYLTGLGTVQPYDTVTVRSRVDGQIIKVAFRQGQMVKEGDLLVQIDPRPYQAALDQALARKEQDEANLKNAKLNLDRYTSLAQKDYASRQQVDTQQAMVDQLTAQVRGDRAAIENAQTQLDYTTIKAPLTGRTGFRLIDPGNIVHSSDQSGIVSIVQLQPISVVFTAPEEEITQINRALERGVVPVKALSSDGLRTLSEGRLALVNNEVDQASGTIRMKATYKNADNALWPGLSVSTRLLVDTLRQVVTVPDSAIQRGPNGLYAFVVGDDNKADARAIKVSRNGEGLSVIEEGLTPGEKVVVAGQYRLQAGSLTQPHEASTSQAPASIAQNISPKSP
jgi:membrane fusion protein, multidrug efflux system